MRYELTDYKWTAIKLLPNKPHGVPRVNDRRVLNGIFWVLRSGAPWRDLPDVFGFIHMSVTPPKATDVFGRRETTSKVNRDSWAKLRSKCGLKSVQLHHT
jgi:transposase